MAVDDSGTHWVIPAPHWIWRGGGEGKSAAVDHSGTHWVIPAQHWSWRVRGEGRVVAVDHSVTHWVIPAQHWSWRGGGRGGCGGLSFGYPQGPPHLSRVRCDARAERSGALLTFSRQVRRDCRVPSEKSSPIFSNTPVIRKFSDCSVRFRAVLIREIIMSKLVQAFPHVLSPENNGRAPAETEKTAYIVGGF